MTLKQCSGNDALNLISLTEQNLTLANSVKEYPLIAKQGTKTELIIEIIKIIEYYLKIIGKNWEIFQIRALAGDLYQWFKNDTLEDVILFFKMIRTGELGKVGYTDSFHEKIMAYIPAYMEAKSAEREKLIEEKKRKRNHTHFEISEETKNRFEELSKRINAPIERDKNIFSINETLKSIDKYLEKLPEECKNLSDSDLAYEIRRTQYNNKEAYEILVLEQESRKQKNNKNDKNK